MVGYKHSRDDLLRAATEQAMEAGAAYDTVSLDTPLRSSDDDKTSDAIATLGKVVADSAGSIDDKLGARYGDYARTADVAAESFDGLTLDCVAGKSAVSLLPNGRHGRRDSQETKHRGCGKKGCDGHFH